MNHPPGTTLVACSECGTWVLLQRPRDRPEMFFNCPVCQKRVKEGPMKRMHAVGFARPVKTSREEIAEQLLTNLERERAAPRVTISYDPTIAWGYHAAFVVNRSRAYVSLFAVA